MSHEDQSKPPEPQHYPEAISRSSIDEATETHEPSAEQLFQTPEGYLELEQESRELQQALALDFSIWTAKISDGKLRERAQPHVDALNSQRGQEDQVDITKVTRPFLQQLMRPKWHEHFPVDDSEEEQSKWRTFSEQWPEHIQENLEELLVVDGELRQQAANPVLMKEVNGIREEQLEVMRTASAFLGADRTLKILTKREAGLRAQAALSNRGLTRRERTNLEAIEDHRMEARERQAATITSSEVVDEVAKRRAIKDVRDLHKGLLLTDQMEGYIDYVLPSLVSGNPVLLIGDTGGAKTAFAKFISREYLGKEPEFISGNSEVNGYQLAGKSKLRPADKYNDDELDDMMKQIGKETDTILGPQNQELIRKQAIDRLKARTGTVSDFDFAPMTRAMEQGVPLIIDEINAIPADFLKRLNEVALLRPGQPYTPQEDSGKSIMIQPGFCIIATANEKSKRYKGVEDLSVELANRFGANRLRIEYPDALVPDGRVPKDNLRLALAFLRDRSGNIDPSIDLQKVGSFVRAAHVTQKLFTGSDIPTDLDPAVVARGVKDAVIAPRNITDILAKIKEGKGFDEVLINFVNGFKDPTDRKALTMILEKNSFNLGTNGSA